MSGIPTPENDRAATVAVEFLQAYLEDQASGRTRTLSEYQALFPGHEATVATEFAAVHAQHDPGEETVVYPGQGSRYTEGGLIGRGGMGRVTRVTDPSLGREVAMKTLMPDGGDLPTPRQLRRFLHEARVLAHLQHPGIVTVHEIGLDANRCPYFTMPLIEGQDLQQIVATVHRGDEAWSLVRALDVMVRCCEAVAHAHERGVVHRDLKPANVMVGANGETYVVDWGLARLEGIDDERQIALCTVDGSPIDQASDDVLRTLDGDVIGTPAYMSPEQARGEITAIGPTSDVYALGALMYHLLSGLPPFAMPDDRPDSKETLSRVLAGPPPALTRLNHDLPPELVSICERAMSRSPGDRYPSAAEMGRDLRAFLENRVVRAHSSGWFVGLWKWVRRNRLTAAALLLTLLTLSVALVVTSQQKRESDANAVEAMENFDLAMDAAEELLADMGLSDLNIGAGVEPLRRVMLRKAHSFYHKFLRLRGDDPRLLHRIALSHLRLAALASELGQDEEARKHLKLSEAGYRKTLQEGSDTLAAWQIRQRLAVIRAQRCVLDATRGEPVVDELNEIEAMLAGFREQHPDNQLLMQDSIMVLSNLARSLLQAGNRKEALQRIDEQLVINRALADLAPKSATHHERLGTALCLRGQIMRTMKRLDDAERDLKESITALDRGLELLPGRRGMMWRRCEARNVLAIVYRDMKRQQDAVATLEASLAEQRIMVAGSPSSARMNGLLGGTLCNYGIAVRDDRGDEAVVGIFEESERYLDRALAIDATQAIHRSYQRTLAVQYVNSLNRLDRSEEAEAVVEKMHTMQPEAGRKLAAVLFACCGIGARNDKDMTRATRLEDKSMALLLEEEAAGTLPVALVNAPELRFLKTREAFQQLRERVTR